MKSFKFLLIFTYFFNLTSYIPAKIQDNTFTHHCLAPKSNQIILENYSLQLELMKDFAYDMRREKYELAPRLAMLLEEALGNELIDLANENELKADFKEKEAHILLSWNKSRQYTLNNETSFKEYKVGLNFTRKKLFELLKKLQTINPQLLQELLAEKIYDDLPNNPLEKEIKAAFASLEILYPDGAEAFLYNHHFKKTKMNLLEASDIIDAGRLGAVKILQKMQHWLETKGQNKDEKFVWMMATGKTPDIMLDFIHRVWRDWDQPWVKDFIKEHGINKKLPMERLIITHLDTTLPQQRDNYHAFPTYINQWAKKFGVPSSQRKLWYGDFILDENSPEKIRVMTDGEFQSLMNDIDVRGLLVEKFENNQLPQDDFQYAFFKAMQIQCEKMSAFLKEYGGPDLVIGSCGPSYEGFGHVGFVESGYGKKPSSFIGAANYHNAGAQGMLNGGYSNMLDKNSNIKYGYATFAIPEMTMKSDAEMVMLINGNNSKEKSVHYAIEGDYEKDFPKAPVVGLSKSKGTWIVDSSTNTMLRKNYYPWDMKILPNNYWTEQNLIKFFIRVVKDIQKRKPDVNITNLSINDFLSYGFDKGKVPPMINWIREQNIKKLTESRSWSECLNIVNKKLTENLNKPNEVDTVLWGKDYVKEISSIFGRRNKLAEKLKSQLKEGKSYLVDKLIAIDEEWIDVDKEAVIGKIKESLVKTNLADLDLFLKIQKEYIDKRKTIFMPDPHPDDRYLAIQSVIDVLIKKGHRVITQTLTPGSSAVSNKTVARFIEEWATWDQNKIDESIALDREKASIALLKLTKKNKLKNKQEALDFGHWNKLSKEEKVLRSQLLFSYVFHKYCEGNGLDSPKKIEQFKKIIIDSFEKKKLWGSKNLTIVDKLKMYVRVIEEKSAMLSWGVPYRNIYDPASFAWYSPVGKNGAARPEDIDYFVSLFEKLKRVDLVFGNDENFIDFGAHSITKSIVLGTLKKLKEKGYFDNNPAFRFMGYAGVWDGISTEDADLTVVYSEQEKEKFFEEFWQIYMSQVPAEGCDPSMNELNTFADAVIERGEKTKEEYLSLFSLENRKNSMLKDSAYALSFTVKDIFASDFDEKLEIEKEILESIGPELLAVSTETLYGVIKGTKMLDNFSDNALFNLYLRVKAMGRKATEDFFNDLIKSGYVTQESIVKMYSRTIDQESNKEPLNLVKRSA